MPIESVQRNLHIRRKKNELVFENIARLWELHQQAKNNQEILDGLHPWQSSINLKFENTLQYWLALIGAILCLCVFIAPAQLIFQLTFFAGLACIFWAWLSLERNQPIQEVIQALEQKIISEKYQLDYFASPPHLRMPLKGTMLESKLKLLFPLFNLGTIANDFPLYASSHWTDEHGVSHPVIVFQYRYVTEITIRDKHGDKVRIQEVEQFKYGVFVFDINKFQGLAVSSQVREFSPPYSSPWKTSDILLNRKLYIAGTQQLAIAKQLTPAHVLRLEAFFQKQDGSLLFHPEQHCLCFLGNKNLFQPSVTKRKITDISTLRGHLRTFKLPYLEQLKSDITTLLQQPK